MRYKTEELSNRMIDYVKSKNPIVFPNKMTMEINNLRVHIPEENYNIDHQLSIKYSGKGNTEGYISGSVIVKDQHGNTVDKTNYRKLFSFPVLTDRGTFIINGNEKNIVSQMRLKPGCYTVKDEDKNTVKTSLLFSREDMESYMPSLNMVYDGDKNKFDVSIKGSKTLNMNIVNFLSSLGFNDMEIQKSLGNDMFSDSLVEKYQKSKQKSIMDIFKMLYPKGVEGVAVNEERARELVYEYLSKNAVFGDSGESVISSTVGLNNKKYLDKELISKATKKTMNVATGLVEEDNKDDLKFKNVYDDNDLLMEAFMDDFDGFVDDSSSKMSGAADTASQLTKIKYSASKLSGGEATKKLLDSELTQSSEEINPLFMETLHRKVTQIGPKGMTKNSTRNADSARNLSASGMNRIDPVETPESSNIGLIQHLSLNAKIQNNNIVTSYYKVINEEALVEDSNKFDLDPIEEEKNIVAFNDTKYVSREGNKLVFRSDLVPARYLGKTEMYPISKIQFIDASPKGVLGTAGNLIPFVSHDDGSRVLMGASMQKQAINLINREIPMVSSIYDKEKGITFEDKVGKEHGKPVMSATDGIVTNITDSVITVTDADGKEYPHSYHRYYPLNQTFMNNDVKVSTGDTVREGQMLAEGWQTKDGKLALGANARVGFLPYKGYNYEDGTVISESFSKKMTTEEATDIEFDLDSNFIGGRGSGVKKKLMAYTVSSALGKLDKDGIIRVGEYIKAGSVIVSGLKEISKTSADLSGLDALRLGNEEKSYKYTERQIPGGSYVEGKVVRVTAVDNPDSAHKQKLIITVVANKPLKIGDKISGRHGNKGIVTKVLPDDLMPTTSDGKPLELLFSPLAVPSRKNVGQIFEVNAGLIAEKTGKPYHVDNFNHEEKERVLKELKNIGYPEGKLQVILKEQDDEGNIIDVPVENGVTVGNMYILKLKHKVDEKIQARSNIETYVTEQEYMPGKIVGTASGEKGNPQRLGEMEMRAFQGHGAVWNLLESTTIKSDGGGDRNVRAAMYKALATGNLDSADLKRSATPETMKIMASQLKTIGFNVKPMYNGKEVTLDKPFDSLGIAPLNGSEFIRSIGENKEVYSIGNLKARQFYGNMEKDNPEDEKSKKKKKETDTSPFIEGGLLDPNIFGDKEKDDENEMRGKWGYIKLATPVPNPMLFENSTYNPYIALTGLSKKELDKINQGQVAVVIDSLEYLNSMENGEEYKGMIEESLAGSGYKPGDFVSVDELDKLEKEGIMIPAKTGGDAIYNMLSKIDVKSELEATKIELKQAKGKAINALYKKVRSLEMLDNNKLKASDLMIKYVPVTPTHLRPVTANKEDKSVMVNDMNKLYERIINSSQVAKRNSVLDADGFIEPVSSGVKNIGVASASIYKNIAQLSGKLEAVDYQTKNKLKPVVGGSQNTGVLGGKEGLVRGKMLGKRVDFSGRSVIGVDPTLKLNEAGLPMDMAKQLYRPFIIKELINRGMCEPNESAAKARLDKMDSDVKNVIQEIANDRPILLNRQPSLHKYSIQALKPIIRDQQDGKAVRAIQLNPLVVTGFNADFDGDTMAVHVPVSEKAKEEAKKLMMPVQNLVNPTDGKIVIEIRHEMALGIYQLTKTFRKPEGMPMPYATLKDLRADYLSGKVSSRQAVTVPICPKPTTVGQALFNWTIPDKLSSLRNFDMIWDKKAISGMVANAYKEAEREDFKVISRMDISNMLDRIKTIGFEGSTRSGVSIGSSDFTKLKEISGEIEKAKKKGANLDEWIDIEGELKDKLEKGLLSEDNPLQVMMHSGARASSDQILKMVGMVGIGMDVNKKLIDPITSSHFDGLSPQEYFRLGSDSRKGIYDRAVSTAKPGELTRNVWSFTQDVRVTEKDCKTTEFVTIKKNDNTIKGRYAGKNILNSQGNVICKKGQLITDEMFAVMHKDDTIEYVPVRSPLRCKAVKGVCQKCYGATPGTSHAVEMGTAVGVLASQAIGEPVTQMTMNTFHTGGANSSATLGLPRINNILNLSDNPSNKAIISKHDGIITKIEDTPSEIVVYVGKGIYKIKKPTNGKPPTLRVKVGDHVTPGDFLTIGNTDDIQTYIDDKKTQIVLTNASPDDLFNLKTKSVGQENAMNYTRDYLANSMQYAVAKTVNKGSMDRRHMETIVSKLTSIAKVIDSGDSPYLKGQEIEIKAIQRWNEQNCKPKTVASNNLSEIVDKLSPVELRASNGAVIARAGDVITHEIAQRLPSLGVPSVKVISKPIRYEMRLAGQLSAGELGHDNWLSNMAGKDLNAQIARGATFGQVDKLEDPRARLMAGKMVNVGEGADMPSQVSNGMNASMMNFFSNTLDDSIDKYKKQSK